MIDAVSAHVFEGDMLDVFWRGAAQARSQQQRLDLLKMMAAVVVPRADDWDRASIRECMHESTKVLSSSQCFLCENTARVLHWHHVIQIQHGGSNGLRNFIPLCGSCHGDVHPWMEEWRQDVKGWYCVGDAVRRA